MFAKSLDRIFALMGLIPDADEAQIPDASPSMVCIDDLDLDSPADAFEALRRITTHGRPTCVETSAPVEFDLAA